jgi:hypothetical protein
MPAGACPRWKQIPGRSGKGKRRKSTAVGPLPCTIEGNVVSDLPIVSTTSGFFTDNDQAFSFLQHSHQLNVMLAP